MRYLLPFLCCCTTIFARAQSAVTDSSIRGDAYKQAVNNYFGSTSVNALINQGNEVIEYTTPSQMHQYYLSDQFLQGEVIANGVRYPDVLLLYDLVHDKLVARQTANVIKVEQISEKVESFTLQGHQFERVVADSLNQSIVNTGFYEVLYKGKPITVYARRTKQVEEQIKDMQVILVFNEKNRYFMKKENSWYSVSDKKTVLKVMSDKKKEMEDFVKKNKIRFRKQPELALSEMASYYDSLKNQ